MLRPSAKKVLSGYHLGHPKPKETRKKVAGERGKHPVNLFKKAPTPEPDDDDEDDTRLAQQPQSGY